MKIAIIPARGGSKRIPKKNIKNFLGKPIISYSIKAAISSKLFDKIVVSTDCNKIARVAKKFKAEVPFIRPARLSGDFIGVQEIIKHAIKHLEISEKKKIQSICCIYATAPLIQPNDLIKGYNLMKKGNWNSVIAASKFSYPILRSFKKLSSGKLKITFPKHYRSRSQDLSDFYHDAGQFCWAKTNVWKSRKNIISNNCTLIDLPNEFVQDIDTIEDWKKAENIFKFKNNFKY